MKLNKKLRRGDDKYNHYEKKLYLSLLQILGNVPKNAHPITVYRGLSGENLDSTYLRELYQDGRVSDQFTSVSISPAVAYNFVKGFPCCVLKIYAIGVQMVYLEPLNIPKYQYEYELLLPPGIVFYYIREEKDVEVREGTEVVGKITLIECVVTQLPDELFRNYITQFMESHNLNLTDSQKRSKTPLRKLFSSQ